MDFQMRFLDLKSITWQNPLQNGQLDSQPARRYGQRPQTLAQARAPDGEPGLRYAG